MTEAIDFSKFNFIDFFNEVDDVFKEFEDKNMPPECYGWRSWCVEKLLEKHSGGQLEWIRNGKGCDFFITDSERKRLEFKQVKDACKKNITPGIILKNFRGNSVKELEKTFDYLIVADIDRRTVLIFDYEYVKLKSVVCSADIKAQLELSEAIQIKTPYDEII